MRAVIVIEVDLPDTAYPLGEVVDALREFQVPHAVSFHAAIRGDAEKVLSVFADKENSK